ncbi:hypothetical protein EB796_020080 [Bugula neritina]|uniref:RAB40B n=1 Tax=Bugula neritina TaxID=10212 RepID=A0A7J7J5W1_BUGNE|nr:hypothetical protein EB796_020080 [Bugula neritina]
MEKVYDYSLKFLLVGDSDVGQGRFCTVLRSYSRGVQGILLVYDITNKWSFEGIERWLNEVNEHAPGVPKILVGNRLHLAYNRQVSEFTAELYSQRHGMPFFEVSTLCDFNVIESFAELSRVVLKRNGMNRLCSTSGQVPSLYELSMRALVTRVPTYGIERLSLPSSCKADLKTYSLTHKTQTRMRNFLYATLKAPPDKARKQILNPQEFSQSSKKSCIIS